MSNIDPFTGSTLGTPQVQRQQSVDKDRQVRHASDRQKNSGLAGDEFDHQVESSEELTPIHEDDSRERRFKRQPKRKGKDSPDDPDDDNPHLDLKA